VIAAGVETPLGHKQQQQVLMEEAELDHFGNYIMPTKIYL
jgi:hypothetical protein